MRAVEKGECPFSNQAEGIGGIGEVEGGRRDVR